MRAIVWTAYGPPDVLELRDLPKPVPKPHEVLVRVIATTVTAGDCELRSLSFPPYLNLIMRVWRGFLRPRENTVPGTELAGIVEAVGENVAQFAVGDRIVGAAGSGFGTNAEYVCVPEEPEDMEGGLVTMPKSMSYAEAATLPFGARDALHFLRKAELSSGEEILVVGAAGSIGTYAVQLASEIGAHVVAVDSAEKLEMLLSIGADEVVDHQTHDYSRDGRTYDVVLDVVGKAPLWRCLRMLKPGGRYAQANPRLWHMFVAPVARLATRAKVILTPAMGSRQDLMTVREMAEDGKLVAVIDREYSLEEIVEAHRYVETGSKQGHVVIQVAEEEKEMPRTRDNSGMAR